MKSQRKAGLFSQGTIKPAAICLISKIPTLENPALNRKLQSSTARENLSWIQNQIVQSKFSSISHTAGYCISAVSTSPIGVDIETRDRKPAKALTRVKYPKFLSRQCPLKTWTLLEAALKLNGLGIAKARHLKRKPSAVFVESKAYQLALASEKSLKEVYFVLMGFGTKMATLKMVENTTKAKLQVFSCMDLKNTSKIVAKLKKAMVTA